MEVSGQFHFPEALPLPREIAPAPNKYEARWPPELVRRFWGKKNFVTLSRYEPWTVKLLAPFLLRPSYEKHFKLL